MATHVLPRGHTGHSDHHHDEISGTRLAEVATAVVQLHRRYYGRGPTKARAVHSHDVLTVLLEDVYTTVEQTLVERGYGQLVVSVRGAFEAAIETELVAAVERIVGQHVVGVSAGLDLSRGAVTQTFVLESAS